MVEIFKDVKKRFFISAVILFLFVMIGGCKPVEKIFTIGIVSHIPIDDSILKGFKDGMVEMGYVEDKNVKYIYYGATGSDDQNIDVEIKKILAQDVDLLLTAYNEAALRAKKAVEGTDIPVLAVACSRPVEIGLVNALSHPGGNITGVQVANTVSKGLEWLVKITPHAKRIYLPYNPADTVSILYLDKVDKTAAQLGVELVHHEVHSAEEAIAAIKDLPKDVDAFYAIPSPTLYLKAGELCRAAIKRGFPVGSGVPFDKEVLLNFDSSPLEMGKQTARMANEIRHGAKPSELPFETAEVFLTINLKTAEKIGLTIPDDVLAQANNIIR